MSYWDRARPWASRRTTKFNWYKAIPSAIAGLAQGALKFQPMNRALIGIGVAVATYLILHAGEYLWNLLVLAPSALDHETATEISGLKARISELEQRPKKQPHEIAKLEEIASIVECGVDEALCRNFLQVLVKRQKDDYGRLRLELVELGMSSEDVVRICDRLARTPLVIRSNPTPLQHYTAIQVNPEYKDLLLEFLHGAS